MYRELEKSLKDINIFKSFANTFAKISLKYNIPINKFIYEYKKALIKEAKNQYPEYNVVELACRTGIDRRDVTKFLKNEDIATKISKIKLVFIEVVKVCKLNNTNLIKQTGRTQSFESICNQIASGALTHKSIANELLRLEYIKKKSSYFEIIETRFSAKEQNFEEYNKILCIEMDRMTNTVIYNTQISKVSDKQFQRNMYSTQIPVQNFTEVKGEFSKVLKKAHTEIDGIISQYETDVPKLTYPAFGASMFIFGFENSKNKEE